MGLGLGLGVGARAGVLAWAGVGGRVRARVSLHHSGQAYYSLAN